MDALNDLAHAAGWEPYNLQNLERVSRVSSVLLHRSCTPYHDGRLVSIIDYLYDLSVDDMSDVWKLDPYTTKKRVPH